MVQNDVPIRIVEPHYQGYVAGEVVQTLITKGKWDWNQVEIFVLALCKHHKIEVVGAENFYQDVGN